MLMECLKANDSKKPKKKTLVATWSDNNRSELESEDQKKVTNLCLMAIEDKEDGMCLKANKGRSLYLKKSCLRQKTRDKNVFKELMQKQRRHI